MATKKSFPALDKSFFFGIMDINIYKSMKGRVTFRGGQASRSWWKSGAEAESEAHPGDGG
jgi:hypothetical protein